MGSSRPALLSALVCALLLAAAGGRASAQRRPTNRGVTITTHEVTTPSFDVTPDGRTIIFSLIGQLWSLPATGGMARPLTDAVRDSADDADPLVSPNGRWLLFRSDRPRGRGRWLGRLVAAGPGHGVDSLSFLIPEVTCCYPLPAAWSPDSRRVAYVQRPDWRIHVHDLATGSDSVVRPADPPRFTSWVAWAGSDGLLVIAGGHPWRVNLASQRATPFPFPRAVRNVLAPVFSPDGSRVAFFAPADTGSLDRLCVWTPGDSSARVLVEGTRLGPPARWTPDGRSLIYSSAGKLWRVTLAGGSPTLIPFTASLTLPLPHYADPVVALPRPGQLVPAPGFTGLALAPAGRRYAMIALGQLWLADIGSPPRALRPVPLTAHDLAWSPDGASVVWSAGSGGSEDLFVTDVRDGHTRQLTALPGTEALPSWSPDGRWIAFAHWARPEMPRRAARDTIGWRIRVVAAKRTSPATLADTRDLGAFDEFLGSAPPWNAASSAVLEIRAAGWPINTPDSARAVWLALDDTSRVRAAIPYRPSFPHVERDGSLTYVQDALLWRAAGGRPRLLSRAAALYPSVAEDGTVLFASGDGLRLVHPDGGEERIGWPLHLQVRPAPPPLLLRNVRVIGGGGRRGNGQSDILIEHGRIARITAAHLIRRRPGVAELDAHGRVAIPGLIDAHVHVPDVAALPAQLYFGVTTVREMGGDLAAVSAARDAVLAGTLPGPRIIESGIMFYPSATTGGWTGPHEWMPRDSATMARGLDLLQAFGAGHVKLRYPVTMAASALFVRLARKRGFSVSGHCAHPLPLVLAGINGQEHLDGECDLSTVGRDDRAQLYRVAGVWGVSTIYHMFAQDRAARDTMVAHDPEAEPFLTPRLRTALLDVETGAWLLRDGEDGRRGTRWFHDAGLRLALGTDAPERLDGVHGELEELVTSGLTPAEALVAATSNAARMLGIGRDVGSIAVGKIADLVLLDADPLVDIRNTRRIWQVVQGGRIVDRQALRQTTRLDAQRAADSDR